MVFAFQSFNFLAVLNFIVKSLMDSLCIAFHSYKGGTGKTTIACNFAALLAKRGYSVGLLDLDMYAPSIHAYFELEPKKWINDYLNSSADLDDVMTDGNQFVFKASHNLGNRDGSKSDGSLWLGFSNPRSDDVLQLETTGTSMAREVLRKLILLKEKLLSELRLDYLIIDTSPGIRTWSINALAISDLLLLTLKSGDLDSKGTKRLVEDIYSTFARHGSRTFLLYNRMEGFCIPPKDYLKGEGSAKASIDTGSVLEGRGLIQNGLYSNETKLSVEVGIKAISFIPCFCDIQF
jgi:chromosome partitioning protein